MKKGIKVEFVSGDYVRPTLDSPLVKMADTYVVRKSKGKLTLDEIEDAMREVLPGAYAIVLRCDEGNGYDFSGEKPKGDVVELCSLEDGDVCPVCAQLLPPQYCPECGADLREVNNGKS